MILKKRGNNKHLEGLHALQKRLPENHPIMETVIKKIAILSAGVRGEAKLETIFETYSFLEELYILHDLSFYSTGHAQVDCLVITPNFALILEVKNIAGELSFLVGTGQISRILENGQVDYFESPMVQLDRNSDLLMDWFRMAGFDLPILGAVILPNATQKVNVKLNDYPVLFPGEVPSFIKRSIKKIPKNEPSQAKEIAEKLLKEHKAFNPFPICSRWNVNASCLKKGVLCPKCTAGEVIRHSRKWVCQACHHKDADAHRQAIQEWFMLVGGELTNKKCRDFLQIESHQLASRLLGSMNLKIEGYGKSTRYKMEFK